MKRGLLFRLISALLVYAHVFWSTVVWAETRRPAGVVTALTGEALLTRAIAPDQPLALKFRDDVFFQDRIRTKAHSIVRVLLGGKAVVTVRALSDLTLSEEPQQPAVVNLVSGKIALDVARSRMKPGEAIEVHTPNAIAAVRGTMIIVEVLSGAEQAGPGLAAADPDYQPRRASFTGETVPVQAPTTITHFHVLQGSIDISAPGKPGTPPVTLNAGLSLSVTGTTLGQPRPSPPAQQLTSDLKAAPPHAGTPEETKQTVIQKQQTTATALAEILAPKPSTPTTQQKDTSTGSGGGDKNDGGGSGSCTLCSTSQPPPPPPPPPTTTVIIPTLPPPPPPPSAPTTGQPLVTFSGFSPSVTLNGSPLGLVQSGAGTQTAPPLSLPTAAVPAPDVIVDLINPATQTPGQVLVPLPGPVEIATPYFATWSSGQPVVLSGGIGLDNTHVVAGGNNVFSVNGAQATLQGGALVLTSGSSITGANTVLEVVGGGSLKSPGAALISVDSTSSISASTLVAVGAGGSTLALTGPLLSLSGGGTVTVTDLVNVAAGGTLDFQANTSIAGPGTFTNAGTVLKSAGTGTASIATPFNNSGTVSVQSGTLALTGGGSNTGSFNVGSGTTLNFGSSYTLSTGSSISGTGTTQVSAGTLTIGDNTIISTTLANSSAVSIGAGTLSLNGGASGTGTYAIALPGILDLHAGTSNIAGAVSGTGSLQVSGATVTLSGVNTYSGGTTVSAGTLDGTTASLQGNITDNAAVSFTQGTNGTYAGVLSGTGALVKAGTGTVTLSGANTYTGTTTINAGTLQAGVTNAVGSGSAVTVGSGATFSLNNFTDTIGSLAGSGNVTLGSGTLNTGGNNASTSYSGIMSGTGSLTKTGTGTLTLSGANTYSGGTTVSAGTLDGTTTGLQGNITDNAAVSFTQGTNGTYAGIISGTGSLTKLGSGTVTLSGVNTYGGGTTVSAGTLQLTGSGTSTSSMTVASGATLQFGGGTYNLNTGALLTGAGSTLISAGTVNVNDSGIYRLSGTTSVTGGTLASPGDLVSLSSALSPAGVMLSVSGSGNLAVTGNLVTEVAGGALNVGGALLTKTGASSLTIGGNLLNLSGGSSATVVGPALDLTSTSVTLGTSPLISLTGGSTLTAGDLIRVAGTGNTLIINTASPSVTVSSGSTLAITNHSLDLTNVTLNLGAQALASLTGGSTLNVSGGPAFLLNNSSLTARTTLTMDNTTNHLIRSGGLFDLTNSSLTLQSLAESGATDTFSVSLSAGQADVRMTDSNVTLTSAADALSTLGGKDVAPLTHAGVALIATDTTGPADHTITLAGPLLRLVNSVTLTDTAAQVQLTNMTVLTSSDLIAIDFGGTYNLSGPLLSATGGTLSTGFSALLVEGGTVTSTTTSPLLSFTNVTTVDGVDVGSSLAFIDGSSTVSLQGSLVNATNSNLSVRCTGECAAVAVTDSQLTTSATAAPLINLSGGTLTLDPNVRAFALTGGTVTLSGPLFKANGTTLNVSGTAPFMVLDSSSLTTGGPVIDLTSTSLNLGTQPVALLLNGSTLTPTGPVLRINGGSLTADAITSSDGAGNHIVRTGGLLDLTNATVTLRVIADRPVVSTDTVSITLASGDAEIRMADSNLTLTDALSRLVILSSGGTQAGVVLIATNGTGTPKTISVGGPLLSVVNPVTFTNSNALVQLTNMTVSTATGDLVEIRTGGTVNLAGPVLNMTGGTLSTPFSALLVKGGTVTSTTASPLLSFTNVTTVDGVDVGSSLAFIDGSSTVSLQGSLLNATNSNLSVRCTGECAAVAVTDSQLTTSATAAPLVNLSGGTLTLDPNVRAFALTGATVTLSGPLFRANGTTLNVSGTAPFMVLDSTSLTAGGPSMDLTNTTLNLGTQPVTLLLNGSTMANTAGPVFNLTTSTLIADSLVTMDPGSNTSSQLVNGNTLTLGTDQPLRGPGSCPPCPLPSGLLNANGATVTLTNAVVLDTALLEATAPLINLLNGSTMTANSDLIQLAQNAQMNLSVPGDALIKLNASTLTVNNGSLFNVAGGSYLNVTGGSLFSLNNTSTLNITGGALVTISGGSVFSLASGGSFGLFGATGTNTLNITNTAALCGGCTLTTTIPNLAGVPVLLTNGALAANVSVNAGFTPFAGPGAVHINVTGASGAVLVVSGATSKVKLGF